MKNVVKIPWIFSFIDRDCTDDFIHEPLIRDAINQLILNRGKRSEWKPKEDKVRVRISKDIEEWLQEIGRSMKSFQQEDEKKEKRPYANLEITGSVTDFFIATNIIDQYASTAIRNNWGLDEELGQV